MRQSQTWAHLEKSRRKEREAQRRRKRERAEEQREGEAERHSGDRRSKGSSECGGREKNRPRESKTELERPSA